MATRNQSNHFLAGVFVIAAILASVVVIIVLSGVLDTMGTKQYTLRFALGANIGGLQPGAEVRVGGRRVGVVESVEFVEGAQGAIEGIDVGMRIAQDIRIAEDALAYLELPLLGTQGVINFPDLGTGSALAEGGTLRGALAPPTFLAQAGYGDEEKANLQSILANARSFSEKLDGVADRTVGAIDGASATIDDARVVVSNVRTDWENLWRGRIDSITANIDETTEKAPAIADDLQQRIDDVEVLFSKARTYLDDNKDNVDAAIANARDTTENARAFSERLNGELTDRFVDILNTGKAELEKAGDSVATVGEFIDEQKPSLRKSLGNFRLASDQLRDTLIEVRRSPWRLIYRPDMRELEYELLYDAARSYAGAVSDLRAATESMQVILSQGGLSPEEAEGLLDRMNRAYDGYQEAEDLFLERIAQEAEEAQAQ